MIGENKQLISPIYSQSSLQPTSLSKVIFSIILRNNLKKRFNSVKEYLYDQ